MKKKNQPSPAHHSPNPRRPGKTILLIFSALLLYPLQSAVAEDLVPVESAALDQDGWGFEEVVDPAITWFGSQVLPQQFGHVGRLDELNLNAPVTLEHLVPLPDGRHLLVKETFTISSWLRREARAVLFLSGSVFRGDHWMIPVEGYNGAELAAQRGYFAYTVDYLGVGGSSRPEIGWEISRDTNRDAMAVLLRYIRYFRRVPRIDLVGEGYGGSIATQLGADAERVRSVTTSAMIYTVTAGGPLSDPNFVEMLESSPTGYFFIPGAAALIFMAEAPQAAQDFVNTTQGGLYPVLNFLGGATLPNLNPAVAQVPGLVIHGDLDFIAPTDDIRRLAADFGVYGARFVSHPNAGHAPRIESPEIAAWYWQTVFNFMEQPNCFFPVSSSPPSVAPNTTTGLSGDTPCLGAKLD